VHRAGQSHIHNCPQVKIPDLNQVIQLYEQVTAAGGAFAPARVVAIALNTGHLPPDQAAQALQATQVATGLPCTDVFRYGADPLLPGILG
jgi:uncharacterized NAD-dependent epimerase/dehydratase family protein